MKTKRLTTARITRESGIELLKILAIVLIVTRHVVQTLSTKNPAVSSGDFVIDLDAASGSIRNITLQIISQFGALGNMIFFICSSWFLLKSFSYKRKKWFFILVEVWTVSVVILAITYFVREGNISGKIILKSFFPTLFANNWYLTCYLLFYPIHPLLNIIIEKLNQKQLFRLSLVLFILYFCFGIINPEWFFPSKIILWIAVYFIIAYMRLYMTEFIENKKKTAILLIIGIICIIGVTAASNILGMKIPFLSNKMLHWAKNCNPFLLITAIALFNLFRGIKFKNHAVNYIASLALLIYIIHENLILRTYFRPLLLDYAYQQFGHNNIILWVNGIAVVVFAFALVCSIAYDLTLRKLVRWISDKLYELIRKGYLRIEKHLLKY